MKGLNAAHHIAVICPPSCLWNLLGTLQAVEKVVKMASVDRRRYRLVGGVTYPTTMIEESSSGG